MPTDAKHNIFLSEKRGGIGIKSFTREYTGSVIRDIEVFITNKDSLPAHALLTSIETATEQCMWNLHQAGLIPQNTAAIARVQLITISGKKTSAFYEDMHAPTATFLTQDHTHMMERAVIMTS
jgi:hypothetical protein